VEIVATIYVISLVLAYQGLSKYQVKNIRWVVFVIINVLVWFFAYSSIRQGYQADAAGTAGSGSSFPMLIAVGAIALCYHIFLFALRASKKQTKSK